MLWGMLHGLGLVVVELWRRTDRKLPAPAGWLLTFLFFAVVVVLFRAPSLEAALNVYAGMAVPAIDSAGALLHRRTLLLLMAVGLLLPTAQQIAQRVPLTRAVAVALGIATAAVLIRLNGAETYEVIYFQF